MLSMVKGLATKFCFCLGLGTATYYSYGTVQKWVHVDQVQVVEHKVQKQVSRDVVVENTSEQPQEIAYQPITAAPQMNLTEALQSAVAAAPAEAAPAEAGEVKENAEEKKDETASTEENPDAIAAQAPVPQHPFAYPAVSNHSNAAPEERTPAAANNNQSMPAVGAVASPSPSQSPAPSSSSSSASSSGSYVGTGVGTNSGSGVLTANDLSALTSPLKATIEDAMVEANGNLFTRVNETKLTFDGHKNHIPVHSLRWNSNEGIKSELKFAGKASSQVPVEFSVEFTFQKFIESALTEEKVSLTLVPSATTVNNVIKDGKNYRVIEFQFADITVRGEALKKLHATFMYEVTAGVLSVAAESHFSFSRAKVETLLQKWSTTEAHVLTPGESVFFPDEISSSMKIEKSL